MSVSLNPTTGLLTATGTAGEDAITAKVVGTTLQVTENGVTKSFAVSKVKKISVDGKAGADTIKLDASVKINAVLRAGEGPTFGSEQVQGGSGHDVIYGSSAWNYTPHASGGTGGGSVGEVCHR